MSLAEDPIGGIHAPIPNTFAQYDSVNWTVIVETIRGEPWK